MKNINKLLSLSFIAAAIGFSSCDKDSFTPAPTSGVEGMAQVKLIHASPYFGATTSPAIQIKINGVRVTSNISYSYPFPGGGSNTQGDNLMEFLSVTPGAATISLGRPNYLSNTDSIELFSGAMGTVEANKYYDVLISDTAANTKVLLAEQTVAPIDTTVSKFRFANLIPNLPSADIYFGSEKVASAVAYNTVSPEFTIVKDSSAKWSLRPAGAAPTSTAIVTYPTTATGVYTVPEARALTVFSRGYTGVTGVRAPQVSLYYNKYYK